ncbi:hypothetical protein BV20DRAFT_700350 [Pilatotrama ljubarskyi]|nr:hypothetical protein BV20DRAFT_700350 [Pilatotrama ljubarskyi]
MALAHYPRPTRLGRRASGRSSIASWSTPRRPMSRPQRPITSPAAVLVITVITPVPRHSAASSLASGLPAPVRPLQNAFRLPAGV